MIKAGVELKTGVDGGCGGMRQSWEDKVAGSEDGGIWAKERQGNRSDSSEQKAEMK